ncbi:MAG: hypothetical protein JWP97_716 [Labilithrix sp.]|nr:hypothetical protein [Labilithrix sp.]
MSESEDALGEMDQRGVARIQQIDWSHPRLSSLSDAARLVYACLVDGVSGAAKDTIDSVDLVWQTRLRTRQHRRFALHETELRETLDDICLAVEELVDEGLLVLRDERSIRRGWVVRPWEHAAS